MVGYTESLVRHLLVEKEQVHDDEKRLFLLEAEKTLKATVEEELKRRYTWIGIVAAILVAFLGTGSYTILVTAQLQHIKNNANEKIDEAIRKLAIAEEIQKRAGKEVEASLRTSSKISEDVKATKELFDLEINVMRRELGAAKEELSSISETLRQGLAASKLLSKQVAEIQGAVTAVAASDPSTTPSSLNERISTATKLGKAVGTKLESAETRVARSEYSVFIGSSLPNKSALREDIRKLGYGGGSYSESGSQPGRGIEVDREFPVTFAREVIQAARETIPDIEYISLDSVGSHIDITALQDSLNGRPRRLKSSDWSKLLDEDLNQQQFEALIDSFQKSN